MGVVYKGAKIVGGDAQERSKVDWMRRAFKKIEESNLSPEQKAMMVDAVKYAVFQHLFRSVLPEQHARRVFKELEKKEEELNYIR